MYGIRHYIRQWFIRISEIITHYKYFPKKYITSVPSVAVPVHPLLVAKPKSKTKGLSLE